MAKRNIDNYTGYYDQSSFSTIEQITLAEDVKFRDFNDIDGKFFYKMITPKVDDKNDKPADTTHNNSTNYITLTIPSHLLLSAVKPKTITCGVDPDTGCLKPGLRGYNLLYSKELESGKYTIKKGTTFLVEMLGGEMQTKSARIIAIIGEISEE